MIGPNVFGIIFLFLQQNRFRNATAGRAAFNGQIIWTCRHESIFLFTLIEPCPQYELIMAKKDGTNQPLSGINDWIVERMLHGREEFHF